MKVTAYEMSKPMEEGQNYYSDFDPIAKGYVNTANSNKASATYTLKNKYFKIYLNKPYIAKDGTQYDNYGAYLMTMRKDHPEYFKNNYQFVHNVCPGFYIKHEAGIGNVAKVNIMQLVFCWGSTSLRFISSGRPPTLWWLLITWALPLFAPADSITSG